MQKKENDCFFRNQVDSFGETVKERSQNKIIVELGVGKATE